MLNVTPTSMSQGYNGYFSCLWTIYDWLNVKYKMKCEVEVTHDHAKRGYACGCVLITTLAR